MVSMMTASAVKRFSAARSTAVNKNLEQQWRDHTLLPTTLLHTKHIRSLAITQPPACPACRRGIGGRRRASPVECYPELRACNVMVSPLAQPKIIRDKGAVKSACPAYAKSYMFPTTEKIVVYLVVITIVTPVLAWHGALFTRGTTHCIVSKREERVLRFTGRVVGSDSAYTA